MNLEEIQEQEYVRPPWPELPLALTPPTQIKCHTLCIGFYGISSLFASSLVSTSAPVATVNFQRAKQRSLANVYLEEGKSIAFLIFNEEFEAMKEIHLSEFVFKNFDFQSIILLTSMAKGLLEKGEGANFQVNSLLQQCITTSHWPEECGPKYQEGLSGPGADLIIAAELRGTPLACFVGIYAEYELNQEIIEGVFGRLNGKYGLECKNSIGAHIKKYNMSKFSNKLYL